MNLQAKIDRIKNNLDARSYTVAAGEAVKIIEIAFRKLLIDGLALLSDKDRLKVMQAIIEIGKGEKGVESFGLGQMLAVLRKSKFNDAWEAATSSDLSAIKMINLDALNEIRIKLTHDATEASKFEAEFLFHALEGVIQAFGIMSLEKQEPVAKKVLDKQLQEPHNEAVIKQSSPLGKRNKASAYTPVDLNEAKRLEIQSNNSLPVDMDAFKHALGLLSGKKSDGLFALDLGCARGNVTHSRFSSFSVFEKVIGIDKNEDTINIAKSSNYGNGFEFHALNIESQEGVDCLKGILEDNGKEGFDVIFSALTLHHLSDPLKVLRRLRGILNTNGVIILRGSDDGSKLAFPDHENLLDQVLNETYALPNVSDRMNGRKLYNQLWRAGYRNIKKFYHSMDTVGMSIDERLFLFRESFSYRKNYIRNLMKENPNDASWAKKLEWMEQKLEELEMAFESEDYYYVEQTVVAVGQKK